MHGGHSASLIIPFSNVQRRFPAAGDGEAALVPHDDLAGLGKMPSDCSPGPCRPDNKRFLALAAPGAGVGLACAPDPPATVDGDRKSVVKGMSVSVRVDTGGFRH